MIEIDCPDAHDEEDLVGNLKREQNIKSLSSCSKIGPSESMMMLRGTLPSPPRPYESTSHCFTRKRQNQVHSSEIST